MILAFDLRSSAEYVHYRLGMSEDLRASLVFVAWPRAGLCPALNLLSIQEFRFPLTYRANSERPDSEEEKLPST